MLAWVLVAPHLGLPAKNEAMALTPSACPVGCTAASSPTVHGDPMFKINGQGGVHFWIKEGVRQSLMTWTHPGTSGDPGASDTLSLEGKTFGDSSTSHQWFDEFWLKRSGITVAHFYMEREHLIAAHYGKATSHDGNVEIVLGALKMRVFYARATKFQDPAKRVKYAHLNIDFETSLPESASGMFAELAGIRPMSEATKATLKHAAVANMTLLNGQAGMTGCLCPPPSAPPSFPPPFTFQHGDVIVLQNMFHDGTSYSYLDTCGGASCSAGTQWSVYTHSVVRGTTSQWKIHRTAGAGALSHGDTIHLENMYDAYGASYLDMCGAASCQYDTQWAVFTDSSKDRNGVGTGGAPRRHSNATRTPRAQRASTDESARAICCPTPTHTHSPPARRPYLFCRVGGDHG